MNQSDKQNPNAVDQVVDEIIGELTLEEGVSTANLDDFEFHVLELTLGGYIRHNLKNLDAGVNKKLMKECTAKSEESLDEIDTASITPKKLWKKPRETHKLRVDK